MKKIILFLKLTLIISFFASCNDSKISNSSKETENFIFTPFDILSDTFGNILDGSSILMQKKAWNDFKNWEESLSDLVKNKDLFIKSLSPESKDKNKDKWSALALKAQNIDWNDLNAVADFMQTYFIPVDANNQPDSGLITAYAHDIYDGDKPGEERKFGIPVYRKPDVEVKGKTRKELVESGILDNTHIVAYTYFQGIEHLQKDKSIALRFGGWSSKDVLKLQFDGDNDIPVKSIQEWLNNNQTVKRKGELIKTRLQLYRFFLSLDLKDPKNLDILNDLFPRVNFVKKVGNFTGTTGIELTKGVSVAVNPKNIKLDSLVFVESPCAKGFRIASDSISSEQIKEKVVASTYDGIVNKAKYKPVKCDGKIIKFIPIFQFI